MAFNCLLSERDLLSCLKFSSCQSYPSGKQLEANKITLILEGSISILNERDEVVTFYSSGFVGLNSIFSSIAEWNYYRLICNTKVSILSIDVDSFSGIITNYSALVAYFQYQAKQLDLLLLHYKVTSSCLVNRVNLLPYLSRLENTLFAPGIVKGESFLENNNFLILHTGSLIHDSGKEVYPGQVYRCSSLPFDGEWLSLSHTSLFIWINNEDKEDTADEQSEANPRVEEKPVLNTISFDRELVSTRETERVFVPRRIKPINLNLPNRLKLTWHKIFQSYPIYLQHGSNDCGTACLMMVNRFWRKNLDYSRLLESTKMDRHGSSLSDLVDGGKSVGFSVFPGKSDLSGLEKNDLPVIAHWNSNYYVVVYAINKTHVIVGNPRTGIKHLTRTQFCQSWTGHALWISPSIDFQKADNKSVFLSKFFKLLKPYKRFYMDS